MVRHKFRVERLPIRQVARELGISRNTVRRYLKDETPIGDRRSSPRSSPVRDAVQPRLEALLADSNRWTAGKQRLTATRLHELLVAEGVEVGATLVKELVREWCRQRQEIFVPLTYRPGELAEVDFFEVFVDVGGETSRGPGDEVSTRRTLTVDQPRTKILRDSVMGSAGATRMYPWHCAELARLWAAACLTDRVDKECTP